MDTQANKSAAQDTAGMDPKGKEQNGPIPKNEVNGLRLGQQLCAGEPLPRHPLDYAIAELQDKLNILEQNHGASIRFEDYADAALLNEKRKSVYRAHSLLCAIRCWS